MESRGLSGLVLVIVTRFVLGRWEAIVHNDFGWYNTVSEAHQAVGIIDFDEAGAGSELLDLAWAVYAFSPIVARLGSQPRPWERTLQRVRLFLEAYETESPLSMAERIGLADAIEQRQLEGVMKGIWGITVGRPTPGQLLAHTADNAAWLAWYEPRRGELTDALCL